MSDNPLEHPDTKASSRTPAAPECSGPLILLAEDEPDIRLVTSTRLELNGYRVVTASDGVAACAQLQSCRPDLVLLDLKMPKLDGYGVCKAMKQDPALRDIPVIIFSASSTYDRCLEQQCLLLGADDCIRKPFEVNELLSKIEALLHSRERIPVIKSGVVRTRAPTKVAREGTCLN